jgi:hypothetical protein
VCGLDDGTSHRRPAPLINTSPVRSPFDEVVVEYNMVGIAPPAGACGTPLFTRPRSRNSANVFGAKSGASGRLNRLVVQNNDLVVFDNEPGEPTNPERLTLVEPLRTPRAPSTQSC